MTRKPRAQKPAPTSKTGLPEGAGAPPPQADPKHGGAKRPVEEEDVYGGVERTHNSKVRSGRAKP